MRHTAKRLIPYAVNGVIHVDRIKDVALRRLCMNPKLQPFIRRALKEYGEHYELLVPHSVDDEELQLKRYIQYKIGMKVNLTDLRRKYMRYYLLLCQYGSPAEVLRRWGFEVTYDKFLTEEEIRNELEKLANENKEIKALKRKTKLYSSILYQSRKKNMCVKEYIESFGFKYKGRNRRVRGY